jgi:MFS family permease
MAEAVQAEAHWGRRLLIGGGIALAIVVAVLIASAAVPRWWAQHIGGRVDGSITQGVFVGMFYGFVFTFLALLVFMLVMRRGRTVKVIAIGLGAALLLALPNLLTLGIVLGVGNGAHAGDRILDVEAPAFRGATLAGAIVAGLLVAYIWYLLESRDSARAASKRAESRRDTEPASAIEPEPAATDER